MTIATLYSYAQRRVAAHLRYRRAIAEIRAMSNAELHEMGAFEIDMLEAARRELNAA